MRVGFNGVQDSSKIETKSPLFHQADKENIPPPTTCPNYSTILRISPLNIKFLQTTNINADLDIAYVVPNVSTCHMVGPPLNGQNSFLAGPITPSLITHVCPP